MIMSFPSVYLQNTGTRNEADPELLKQSPAKKPGYSVNNN
jgi:hypothetical protein